MAAYVGRVTKNNSAFKSNLCVVFLVENTFRIVLYTVMEILTWEVLKDAMLLLPAMLLGLFLGMESGKHLKESIVKRAVIILLIFSGIALVWNQAVLAFSALIG